MRPATDMLRRLLALAAMCTLARAKGVFEVLVTRQPGDQLEGATLRVCLKEYQARVSPEPPCSFGSRIAAVQRPTAVTLQFPFSFAWPGAFSLAVDVWRNGTDDGAGQRSYLYRGAWSESAPVSTQWLELSADNDNDNNQVRLSVQCRAVCASGYYGSGCEDSCTARDDQFGHYTCDAAGRKRCLPKWTGPMCDQPVCDGGCGAGRCLAPGVCTCPDGWTGQRCDKCVPYPGCAHGRCNRPYECLCDDGWGGQLCNQDLNYCTHNVPCRNGGTCTNTGRGHYRCECPPGYAGADCEVEQAACAGAPCRNGGTCVQSTGDDDDDRAYTCVCAAGYTGPDCALADARTCANRPCANGGTCTPAVRSRLWGGYRCLCPKGYAGANCDRPADACERPDACLNGGRCVRDTTLPEGRRCVCPAGYSGDRCETDVDDCRPDSCMNGGTCVDLVNSFRCRCAAGFVGSLCQTDVDDCLKRPCANGGRCTDLPNDFRCHCADGFTGKDCGVRVDACESAPCLNGGHCMNAGGGYRCGCPRCFTGPDCGIRHDDCLVRQAHNGSAVILIKSEGGGASTSNGAAAAAVALTPLCVLIAVLIGVLLTLIAVLYKRRRCGAPVSAAATTQPIETAPTTPVSGCDATDGKWSGAAEPACVYMMRRAGDEQAGRRRPHTVYVPVGPHDDRRERAHSVYAPAYHFDQQAASTSQQQQVAYCQQTAGGGVFVSEPPPSYAAATVHARHRPDSSGDCSSSPASPSTDSSALQSPVSATGADAQNRLNDRLAEKRDRHLSTMV